MVFFRRLDLSKGVRGMYQRYMDKKEQKRRELVRRIVNAKWQPKPCTHCEWRKNAEPVCLLPVCMKGAAVGQEETE